MVMMITRSMKTFRKNHIPPCVKFSYWEMIRLIITCLLWYLSSAITNNIGKEILLNFRYPVTLTMVQFGLSSIFAFLYGSLVKKSLRPATFQVLMTTIPLSLFQILGHVFSSVALTYVSVSFSHTIKV